MEASSGREVGAEVFVELLGACAAARPPLVGGEVETVWAQIEVRAELSYSGSCAMAVRRFDQGYLHTTSKHTYLHIHDTWYFMSVYDVYFFKFS